MNPEKKVFANCIGILSMIMIIGCQTPTKQSDQERQGENSSKDLANPILAKVGAINWYGAKAMTNLNGYLYIVSDSYLKRVDPITGTATNLGGGSWWQTRAMTSHEGYLYIAENKSINKVDPANGQYSKVGGPYWDKVKSMTSDGQNLYVVHDKNLYRVNPTDGSFAVVGGAWWLYTGGMAWFPQTPEYIYIEENYRVNKVDKITGAFTRLNDQNDAEQMAGDGISKMVTLGRYKNQIHDLNGNYWLVPGTKACSPSSHCWYSPARYPTILNNRVYYIAYPDPAWDYGVADLNYRDLY